jgi:hypothetical protein
VWTATPSPRLRHDDAMCPPRAPRSAHCGLVVSGMGELLYVVVPLGRRNACRRATPKIDVATACESGRAKGFLRVALALTFTRATSRASARNARGSSRPVRRTFQASAFVKASARTDRPWPRIAAARS